MPRIPTEHQRKLLGDRVAEALASIGITDERFSNLIGRPCKCKERKVWLNQLDLWARRTLRGNTKDAKKYLDQILKDKEEQEKRK